MRIQAKNITVVFLCFIMTFITVASVGGAPPPGPLYYKPGYPDYAPSGMPDFDQHQDGWFNPMTMQWTFCGPVAVANSLWWLDSKYEPGSVPPPTVSDGFGLVTSMTGLDDHDPTNVPLLVNFLAAYMNTNPMTGTEVHDMKKGIDQYLNAMGMNAYFYTHLYKQPTFELVETEVERSQDVVLLLGFWQFDQGLGMWYRFGGHYVTVAGINSTSLPRWVAISDPYFDAAEPPPEGIDWMGRVLPPPIHPHPPVAPDTTHNNATYVSQDIYGAYTPSPSPGGLWGFPDYYMAYPPNFENFQGQNFPVEYLPNQGYYNPSLQVYTEVEYAVVTSPWFAKGQYMDYAPSGMPDFDQKQDLAWTNPWPPLPGSWSYCGPTSVANSMWWFDSKFEPNPAIPPTISDGFPLVQSYNPGVWDDHDVRNVGSLIRNLAWYMDTDGQRTGLMHCGTDVFDMQAGIAQYISDNGVNPLGDCNGDGVVDIKDLNIVMAVPIGTMPGMPGWDLRADVVHDNVIDPFDQMLVNAHLGENWGKFYEKTMWMPDYEYIAHQIKMCEDVVLLLGIWQLDPQGYFQRIGGHFVTAHGIDPTSMTIAISDPAQDNAEQGGQGRVIPPLHVHPAVPPDTVHNDTAYVSHDYYTVGPSPSPGGHWGLLDYNWTNIIDNVWGQNTPHNFTEPQYEWMGFPVFVEIEYSVIVSCRGPMVAAGSQDGNVYTLDYMGNLLWTYNTQGQVVSVAMSERGEYVVAGSLATGLFVFDSVGTLLWSKPIPISESYDGSWMGSDSKTVGISADGSYIVGATTAGLYLYDNLGTLIWHYVGPPLDPEVTCVRISPDGRYIVCSNYINGEINFFSHLRDGLAGWQAGDGSPIWTKTGIHAYWVAIDGCGRYAAASQDIDSDLNMDIVLYNRAGTQVWSWESNRTGFMRIDMPWDGSGVVAANDDPSDFTGTQLVYFGDMKNGNPGWQAADGSPQWIFVPAPDASIHDLYSVAISPDGKVIATGPSAPTNVYLLSKTGAPIQTIADGTVNALDLTFTGEYGVAGDRAGNIHFFTKTRNTILWSFATLGNINSVAIQKRYPCLEPFPVHDVDVTNVQRFTTPDAKVKRIVCQGYPANAINVTLSNHGSFVETVEVTLYAYSSSNNTIVVVGNVTVTINPGAAPVVSITWTSTNVPYYGNYTLFAAIGPVQDEDYLLDNEYVDSGLLVTGVGDVNGDRKCDGKDIAIVSKAFGTLLGQPLYNPNADINCDYKVDGKDIAIASKKFGTIYP